MLRCAHRAFVAVSFLLALAAAITASAEPGVAERAAGVPLHFEANRGQAPEDVRFLSRGAGYTFYFTAREAVLALRPADLVGARAALRIGLVGGEAKPRVSGIEEL